jgi:hypothetical protein
MGRLPGVKSSLLLTACSAHVLACALLGAQTPSSNPEKCAPQPPAAQPQSAQKYTKEQLRRGGFSMLMGDLGWEDIRNQQEIEEGKKPIKESNFQALGLSADEERVMREAVVRAFYREEELAQEVGVLNGEITLSHPSPELIAQRDALIEEEPQVVDELIQELQTILSPSSFEELDKSLLLSMGWREESENSRD